MKLDTHLYITNCNWGYQICAGDVVLDTVNDDRTGPHRSWIATKKMISKVNGLMAEINQETVEARLDRETGK